jgi:hypothetical protein
MFQGVNPKFLKLIFADGTICWRSSGLEKPKKKAYV